MEFASFPSAEALGLRFSYVAVNAQTGYKLTRDEPMTFAFDFRDWLYLSNFERFN